MTVFIWYPDMHDVIKILFLPMHSNPNCVLSLGCNFKMTSVMKIKFKRKPQIIFTGVKTLNHFSNTNLYSDDLLHPGSVYIRTAVVG